MTSTTTTTAAVVVLLVVSAASSSFGVAAAAPSSPSSPPKFRLPSLPYGEGGSSSSSSSSPYDALEPWIGRRTLEIHHDRHHAKYVDTTNSLLEELYERRRLSDKGKADDDGEEHDHSLLPLSLSSKTTATMEDVMTYAHETGNRALYNNAAQAWNHEFYWRCIAPPPPSNNKDNKQGGDRTIPQTREGITLLDSLASSFGGYDEFAGELAAAANAQFGSGWAWLVYDADKSKLEVLKTSNADNPMHVPQQTYVPLLVIDVWEHAYYLDYQNKRFEYVDVFLKKLVDWNFVARNLVRAMETGHKAAPLLFSSSSSAEEKKDEL